MLTIALSLAIAQVGAPASPPAATDLQDEITVIGRKLRTWRGSFRTEKGAARCVTRKSTGDREIDLIGCDAMLICLPAFQAEFQAVRSAGRDAAARSRMNSEVSGRLAACVEERHDRAIGALADRRIGRR